jgi:hypothetical protein
VQAIPKALEALSIRTMRAPSIYAFQRSGLGQIRTYQLIDNDLNDPMSLDIVLLGASLHDQTRQGLYQQLRRQALRGYLHAIRKYSTFARPP